MIAAVALLSACASTPASPGAVAEQTGSNRPTATESVVPEAEIDTPAPEVTTEEPSDEPAAFGSTRTYPDGLTITVSKGTSFRPSQYAAGADTFKAHVKYTITVVNGTGKVFDPSMFTASVQSANVEGDQVYDSAAQIGGGPETKLLKGREAKFTIGFGVSDLKDVVLEVSPSFEHSSVLFN